MALPPSDEHSIGGLFARLIDDAERFVRAEVRLYRAQFLGRVDEAKLAIGAGIFALVLGQAAIVALLVGLLLSLRRPLGPVWATVIVVGGALAICAVLIRIAITGISKATEVKREGEE